MNKKIRHAILIDPAQRKITIVELGDDDLKSAYEHIGCEMIEAVVRLSNGDTLYVDEEMIEAVVRLRNGETLYFDEEMIEAAARLRNHDTLYVDKEALIKKDRPKGKFQFAGQGWFLGKGLIVNDIEITGEGNEWTAPRSAVVDLFKSVVFEGE
jgi:hypothetical protein